MFFLTRDTSPIFIIDKSRYISNLIHFQNTQTDKRMVLSKFPYSRLGK